MQVAPVDERRTDDTPWTAKPLPRRRDRYIVEYERASDDDLYETLSAPPVDVLDRAYSLEEVRYSYELRERMRRIDLDAITLVLSKSGRSNTRSSIAWRGL